MLTSTIAIMTSCPISMVIFMQVTMPSFLRD